MLLTSYYLPVKLIYIKQQYKDKILANINSCKSNITNWCENVIIIYLTQIKKFQITSYYPYFGLSTK